MTTIVTANIHVNDDTKIVAVDLDGGFVIVRLDLEATIFLHSREQAERLREAADKAITLFGEEEWQPDPVEHGFAPDLIG